MAATSAMGGIAGECARVYTTDHAPLTVSLLRRVDVAVVPRLPRVRAREPIQVIECALLEQL
jgi:hypothetical protein